MFEHLLSPALLLSLLLPLAIGRTVDVGGGSGDDGDDDPAPGSGSGAGDGIESAGQKFLAGLSEEERNREFDDIDVDDEDAGQRRAPKRKASSEGAESDEEIERIREGDDTTAGGDELDEDDDETDDERQERETREAAATAGKKGKPAEEKPVLVTLPGIADRGEEDLEVEVDADIAERIRRLKNEGLRGAEYKKRLGDVEQREGRLTDYELQMQNDPVGFHLEHMDNEGQLNVARALILEHLDTLAPEIEELLDDPNKRLAKTREITAQRKETAKKLDRARAVREYTAKVLGEVEKLIPDHIEGDVAKAFLKDARRELAELASTGTEVTPDNVKTLLARRVQLYGFHRKPRTERRAGSGDRSRERERETARPVSDKARDIASRRTTGGAGSETRVRRIQSARTAGRRVAPPGAGAAPVQTPALKESEQTDVKSASAALRKKGLPQTWTSAQ